MAKGWHNESERHRLAKYGIDTVNYHGREIHGLMDDKMDLRVVALPQNYVLNRTSRYDKKVYTYKYNGENAVINSEYSKVPYLKGIRVNGEYVDLEFSDDIPLGSIGMSGWTRDQLNVGIGNVYTFEFIENEPDPEDFMERSPDDYDDYESTPDQIEYDNERKMEADMDAENFRRKK